MKVLNFSAVEILPKLLSKEKTQTIRPAWNSKLNTFVEGMEPEKPARFKVGERVQIHWKSRTSPKEAVFCKHCGKFIFSEVHIDKGITKFTCENSCFSFDELTLSLPNHSTEKELERHSFFKKLGEAEITDVFKIEMGVCPYHKKKLGRHFYVNFDKFGKFLETQETLAKLDGFKDPKEMTNWFDEHYDLSNPKIFWVYRYLWKK